MSIRPWDGTLFQAATRIDRQGDTRDVARLVGGEEQHRVADVNRVHPWGGQHVEHLTDRGHVVGTRVLQIRPEQLPGALVHDHRGADMRGVDGVDANHMLPQLDCEGPHDAHYTVLGSDIAAAVGVGLESAHRAGQDDRTAFAARDHMWHTGFHRLPDARQVYVDHFLPVVFGGLVQRVAAIADARVGHDDVQPAQLLHAVVHRGFQRVVIADIDFGREDPAVQALDQVGGLGQVLGRRCRDGGVPHDRLTDVDGDDVGAFLGQPHRMTAALTACRAGDKSDLALNTSSHGYLIPANRCQRRIRFGYFWF